MPELPEVETLRRSLEPALLGRTIASVRIIRRDIVAAPGDPPGGFARQRTPCAPARLRTQHLLRNDTVTELRRRGKQLAIIGDTGGSIIVQLGMTGSLTHSAEHEPAPTHTHVVWTLDDGSRLLFTDPRRFGLVRLVPEGPGAVWQQLGPDALALRAEDLHARSVRTHRAIKAALLDQRFVAGVGNIYADEALFAAQIHPGRSAHQMTNDDAKRLAAALRQILRQAIARGGSTIRDYRDGSGNPGSFQRRHKVYGRADQPCTRCGHPLLGTQIAQRTTVLCSVCQPFS